MTVRGIEAIKLYMPATNSKINPNVREEKGLIIQETEVDEAPSTMTSVERYRQEWTQLLRDLDEQQERIRDLAFNGELKISKFRSVYWALLLRVLNADHRSWSEQRGQQRKRYETLKLEFVKNPHDIEVADDDPLSQSTQSIWNQYFSDQELFAVIKQDVVRTFPGVDFFRKAVIQNAMSNILFYFAREHPYMCYRQGMHEILAPILFVIYGDQQSLLHFKEIAKTDTDETLLDVLNPDFLESDAYSIFSRLMSSIESYYRVTNLVNHQGGYFPESVDNARAVSSEVEVIGQLNFIRDKILAKEDMHLHTYLMKLDIPLHIFGIRWLRLLFGREFPLLDLLLLWDAIFADSDLFDLPNYVLVAMLIHIRDKLLLSDYTTCLTYLMRYPMNVDINLILRHALHMQMPKKFDRPPNAFVYFTMSPSPNSGAGHQNLMSTLPRTSKDHVNTALPKPMPEVGNARRSAQQQHQSLQRSRSASLTTTAAKMERQITLQQARNAADSATSARLNTRAEAARVAMDGYSANSPELMRLELKNAQTVITIARNKLQSYLATVRKHIRKTNSNELSQALEGIDELCGLLDVKFMFPLHVNAAPVDQALEANEQQQQQSKATTALRVRVDDSGVAIVQNLKPNTVINNTTTSSPPSPASFYPRGTTAYEKPDDGFTFKSSRILGNLREIELIPIGSDEKIVEVVEVGHSRYNGLPSGDPLENFQRHE